MGDEIKVALNEELYDQITKISTMDMGSDEYAKVIEGVSKLYKLRLDERKAEDEFLIEVRRKETQVSEARKERLWKYGLGAGELTV